MIYELLPNKEVLYVVPVTSILGKLPVVRAGPGDTETIPNKYSTATRSGAHRFNAQIARADSRPGAGGAIYFVNSWALSLSRDM